MFYPFMNKEMAFTFKHRIRDEARGEVIRDFTAFDKEREIVLDENTRGRKWQRYCLRSPSVPQYGVRHERTSPATLRIESGTKTTGRSNRPQSCCLNGDVVARAKNRASCSLVYAR